MGDFAVQESNELKAGQGWEAANPSEYTLLKELHAMVAKVQEDVLVMKRLLMGPYTVGKGTKEAH